MLAVVCRDRGAGPPLDQLRHFLQQPQDSDAVRAAPIAQSSTPVLFVRMHSRPMPRWCKHLAMCKHLFIIVNMHSLPEDRTSRAVIRDEALRLFADRGPDAVTIRDIAAAAGVSPALVVRHYRSKDGLRQAVDDHVARALEAALGEMARGPEGAGPLDPAALPSLADTVIRHLPPGSPIPSYLGRMLTGGGAAATALFRKLYEVSERTLAELARLGLADAGDDPSTRAAFLLVNDLGMLMLRARIAEVLGTDPLSPAGMRRWGSQVLSVYRDGLAAIPRGRP